jgi:hypothetical protein
MSTSIAVLLICLVVGCIVLAYAAIQMRHQH